MSTQHDDAVDARPASAPSGRVLMPALMTVAVACQVLAGLQLLRYLEEAPLLIGAVQLAAAVTALAWTVRYRTRSPRVRALCSLAAFVGAAAPTMVGSVGFGVPTIMVASALLVVDLSLTAGLAVNLVFVGALSVLVLRSGRNPLEVAVTGINFLVFLGSGTLLGLVLARYDAVLADQHQALSERDSALVRVERQAAVEKELMLAEERARAAHELHDGLGHRLTQIGMSLEFAARVRQRDPQAAWKEVAVAEAASREAVGEMRTWVRALSPASPSVLSAAGAGAAGLDAVAASFRGTGVRVDVTDEIGPGALTQEAELLIYRAVQEGLTNALRHSRARAIDIRLALAPPDPGPDRPAGPPASAAVPAHVDLSVTNLIPVSHRAGVPDAAVGHSGGPQPGFGVGGLAQRAGELGGTATAGREGDTFRLHLCLPVRTALRPQEES